MRARLLPLALAAGFLALAASAGCDPGGRPDPLTRTARRLETVRSGVLSIRLVVASGGAAEPGEEVGFELQGPFSFDSIGPLPIAEFTYTRIRGAHRTSEGFRSTGHKAYVKSGETFYEIPAEQWGGLQLDLGEDEAGLADLRIDRWLVDPEVADQTLGAGVRLEVIRGGLDVDVALADLLALTRQLGVPPEGSPALLAEAEGVRLARAVRSATAEVVTGRSDRLLRQVAFDVVLAAQEHDPIGPALGPMASARLSLDVRIDDPNKQVTVAEPIGARPLAQLPPRR